MDGIPSRSDNIERILDLIAIAPERRQAGRANLEPLTDAQLSDMLGHAMWGVRELTPEMARWGGRL